MSNCKITIKRNVRGKVQTQRYDSAEALFRDLTFEEIPKEFLPKEAKKELIFGIPAGEGRLTTNLDSSEFEFLNINPTNPEHSNEGRLYLGTESAVPGVLIPSAVRKKDMSEVDLNKEVPLMQQLKSFISQIADAAVKGDQATASQRVQDLRNIIYVGSKAGIPINFRTENNGPISSTYLIVSRGDQVERILIKESELITDNSVEGGFSEIVNVQKSVEEVSQELTQALVNVKAPFQVNKNDINGKWNIDRTLDYNNVLAEADVLTTNLEKNEVSQAYFVMNPLNSKLEEVKVNNSPIKTPKDTGGVSFTDSPLGREVTIEEGTFRAREGNKVYDAKNNLVTDNKTVLKVITHDYLNNLSKEELEAITFKGNEIPGIKSLHMGQTFILMPNNRVWAGNRYLPTTDSTHILIMEMNEKRQAGFSTQPQITPQQGQKYQERLNQVQDVFNENPELANSVYEASGFVQEVSLPTSSETINIYAGSNQNAELSNFAIRPFTTNVETPSGEKQYTFQSVEQGFHFYKALVANNPQITKQILATTSGGQLKRLTSRRNLTMTFEQVKKWDDTSKSIMLNLMYDSYVQNPEAAEKLLATGNAKITHTQDNTRWKTDFPEVVMTVRDMLKEESVDNATFSGYVTQEDTITEEIPLFGKPKEESKETRVRKRPRKGGVINTALDSKQSSEMTAEQIQEEINRQKEYQEKNCPEIKP